MRAALAIVLFAAAAQARHPVHPRVSAKTSSKVQGLGRSCSKSSDCHSRAQQCLKESDANGKALTQGFCVLPCASFESGTTQVIPGKPLDPAQTQAQLKKKPPPRCPPSFLCRSAGSGVPIDMCVKE